MLPMDSPSLLLLCTHDVRFILLGGGGRGRFGDDLDRDDLEGDDLHDEAYEEEVELVADIVDTFEFDNDGDGDDVSPVVLLRRGGVECIILLFGIVMHRCILSRTISFFHSYTLAYHAGDRRRVP